MLSKDPTATNNSQGMSWTPGSRRDLNDSSGGATAHSNKEERPERQKKENVYHTHSIGY